MVPSNAVALSAKPMNLAPGALDSNTKTLANRQVITDLTNTDAGKTAITPINTGEVMDFKSVPKKITITIENTNVGGGPLEVAFLNNDTFGALPGGVTVVDSCGFGGKLLNKLIGSINKGNGLLTFGFNITGYDAAGDKSDAVINSCALEARFYKGYGSSYIPAEIDLSGNERNTQYKDGLLTVKMQMLLSWIMQLKVTLDAKEKVQIVFNTTPMVD